MGPSYRSWVGTFYDGEHRSYLPWVVYVSALHFLYCAAATTLYPKVPAFERLIGGLDGIAAALETIVPVLKHYAVVLPKRGDAQWVPLVRHLAVVSLAVNFVQMVLWFGGRRIFRERIEAYILDKPHGWWWNGSYGRYVAWAVFASSLAALVIGLMYVWLPPMSTRPSRALLLLDGYARSLIFMPAMTLTIGVVVPVAVAMLLGLFSQRLRAGFR